MLFFQHFYIYLFFFKFQSLGTIRRGLRVENNLREYFRHRNEKDKERETLYYLNYSRKALR